MPPTTAVYLHFGRVIPCCLTCPKSCRLPHHPNSWFSLYLCQLTQPHLQQPSSTLIVFTASINFHIYVCTYLHHTCTTPARHFHHTCTTPEVAFHTTQFYITTSPLFILTHSTIVSAHVHILVNEVSYAHACKTKKHSFSELLPMNFALKKSNALQ